MALTTMQKLFCYYYLKLGSVSEAAVNAGYSKRTALSEGVRILSTKQCGEYMEKLKASAVPDRTELVKTGLERLAFGSANDAVKLVFCDDAGEVNIDNLDLFNVSEIKRQKGGAVEVKLFDRQKALELLSEIEAQNNSEFSAESFFEALSESAAAKNKGEENSAV